MADAARYPKTGAPAAAPRSSDAFAEGDDIVDMMAGISIEASSSSPPEASDGEPESAVLNDGEADSSGFIPAKIFVGGLAWCTDEDHLRLHFGKCVYTMCSKSPRGRVIAALYQLMLPHNLPPPLSVH